MGDRNRPESAAVSHAMQEACRVDDFPARIGGDEFAEALGIVPSPSHLLGCSRTCARQVILHLHSRPVVQ